MHSAVNRYNSYWRQRVAVRDYTDNECPEVLKNRIVESCNDREEDKKLSNDFKSTSPLWEKLFPNGRHLV